MYFYNMVTFFQFLITFSWLLCTFCHGNSLNFQSNMTTSLSNTQEVNSILRKIVTHLKSSNAEPLPIPDPFHRPDNEYGAMFKTTNVTITGISSLKMNNFISDLVAMKISFELHLPKLVETGHYTCFPKRSGKFSLTITNAHWYCDVALKITESGQLAVSKIELNLQHRDDMKIYVEDGGIIGEILNSFGDMIFEGMKSYILSVINTKTENYVNEQLKRMQIILPNSIPPIDTFAIEVRKILKNSKYDPYSIPDYVYTSNLLLVEVSQISIHGLSSFHRTGNLSLSVQNDTFQVIMNFGTDRLHGDCEWEISTLGIYSKIGRTSFDIDYVDVFLNVSQPLDLSKVPVVTDVNVIMGNIQLVLDGSSVFEYAIEFAVNLISNWLRHHITKLFKNDIMNEVQSMVNNINVENIIFKHIINEKSTTQARLADSIDMIMKSNVH